MIVSKPLRNSNKKRGGKKKKEGETSQVVLLIWFNVIAKLDKECREKENYKPISLTSIAGKKKKKNYSKL